MAEATKSLAAEVEAVLRKFAHVGPEGQIMGLHEASKVLAALQGRAFEDGARTKVLATGWLKSMGRRDDEERGPVVEFVIDTSRQHAMTFGDIWNGQPHQIVAALPLQPEGESDA
jgi:hypothetical protein